MTWGNGKSGGYLSRLRRYGVTWYSDWKFEPEEMEAIVRNLLGLGRMEWSIPEETIVKNCFLMYEAALRGMVWVLCTYRPALYYLFAIFWLDDIGTVQATAQRLDLKRRFADLSVAKMSGDIVD